MGTTDHLVRRARPSLGTIVEIGVSPEHESTLNAGFGEIIRIHQLMSFHETTSDLAKLRAATAGELIELGPDTISVLRISGDLHRSTNGLFNIAIGRQLIRTGFLPRMDTVHLGRFDGNADDIEIVDDRHVRLRRCTLIDLGGIAKGYAVDCAVAALKAAGATRGIVNAGGDLRVFGDTSMPVQTRLAHGEYSEPFVLRDCAVASSENMHSRRIAKGRVMTPHIGHDGQSIVTNQTVSVIANTCAIADAMTKVAMLDPDLADQLLAQDGGRVVQYLPCEAD